MTTTAAYIILCDGTQTHVFEKDRIKAIKITSDDFAVATNHDVAEESLDKKPTKSEQSALKLTGMDTLVEESIDRKKKMCSLRAQTLRRVARRSRKQSRQADMITLEVCFAFRKTFTYTHLLPDPFPGIFAA